MPAYKTVSVVQKGRTYNGSWRGEDNTVMVSSVYGSKSAERGKKELGGTVAERLLAEPVEARRP